MHILDGGALKQLQDSPRRSAEAVLRTRLTSRSLVHSRRGHCGPCLCSCGGSTWRPQGNWSRPHRRIASHD
ncbi:hypothetical protein KQX54_020746, partial [Cotesia glomerata]